MRQVFMHGIVAIMLLAGCATPTLDEASRSYRANRDYASLEMIFGHLSPGMDRSDVERLLGEPDYSPTDGQFYYASDRRAADGDRDGSPVGVVVDYRDEDGTVTDTLRDVWIGPIGE